MFELFSLLLIVSIIAIIFSIGAIIFSVINKKPNTKYIQTAIVGVIVFVISTIGMLMTKSS